MGVLPIIGYAVAGWLTAAILSFEDAITNHQRPKEVYVEQYGALLAQLDGTEMALHVEFFFKFVDFNGRMEFRDEDSRVDFMGWSEELGTIDKMSEIQQGETEAAI